MGTNYYWHEKPPCEHCGQTIGERLHIGKSSAGWCFSLHVSSFDGIRSLGDWQNRFDLPGSWIADEYGDRVTVEEMLSIITERKWDGPNRCVDAGWIERNHAQQGPNGLMRHKIGPYCVGHGEGTWDLIPGEFS